MGARQYTQREWRLLSWWLATYHPNAEILMNVRVGPNQRLAGDVGPDALEPGVGRIKNRWCDAIFVEAGLVTIVEAKIEPDPGIFSQLIHYARKFRVDPTFAHWRDLPIRLIALVYNDDQSVAEEAPWYGVQWIVYQPALDTLLPPQLRGTALGAVEGILPMDWPARLQAWGIASVGASGS